MSDSTSTPKTDLTPEDEKQYVARGAGRCPFCGDHSIEGGAIEVEATYATQEVVCHACDAAWDDVYRMTGLAVRQTPDGRTFGHGEYPPIDGPQDFPQQGEKETA